MHNIFGEQELEFLLFGLLSGQDWHCGMHLSAKIKDGLFFFFWSTPPESLSLCILCLSQKYLLPLSRKRRNAKNNTAVSQQLLLCADLGVTYEDLAKNT